MRCEGGSAFARNFRHVITALRSSRDSVDKIRKIQRLLDCPDRVVLTGREELSRIADSDPADGKGGMGSNTGTDVDDSVDLDLRSDREVSAVQNGGSCGHKHGLFQGAANKVAIRSDQTMGADGRGMPVRGTDYGIFHDDALCAETERSAFRDDASTKHDSAARTNLDIAADGRSRRDVGGAIDLGPLVQMSEYHRTRVPLEKAIRCVVEDRVTRARGRIRWTL